MQSAAVAAISVNCAAKRVPVYQPFAVARFARSAKQMTIVFLVSAVLSKSPRATACVSIPQRNESTLTHRKTAALSEWVAMQIVTAAVCDQDADGHADGFCVEQDCIAPSVVEPSPTVVLTCGVDGCAPEDRDQPAATTCTGNSGLSCATFGEVSDSLSYFEQQGICICFGGGFCQCQSMAPGGGGDVTCQENGVVLHETACSGAEVPCDDSYTGDFDPDFGTYDSNSGLCAPTVCTPEEERVDINQNNNFDQCGCAHNSQGVLCRVGPSGSEQFGLCAGRDCVSTAPVSRYCNRENCENEVEVGCASPGYACDNSLIQPGQQSFNAEGYCAEVGGVLECVTTGHVCRADSGSGQFFGDCGDCGEDAPCDDTLGDGAFDSSFGTCQSGSCVANVIPNRFSWRDHQGQDWTTPVANQQAIGACTAFGVIASIEAKWNIQNNTHDLNLNLSEQQAVSCGGYTAAGGGSVTLDYAVVDGFTDEACLPWANSSTLTCELCANADDRLWKITGFRGVTSYRNEFKVRIMRDGPVVAHLNAGGMTAGPTGVYYCPTNQGGHVVSVVGWDDVGGYWIIKNSWGPAWDGDGFFNLGYNECGLVPKYTIDSVVAP